MPLADFFMLSKEQILQKADKLRAEGKHAKAAELLFSGLKNAPDDFELLTAMASAHLADRKGRDAALALKNAMALAPGRSAEILDLSERFFFSEGHLPELGDLAFDLNVTRRNFDSAVKILKALSDRDVDVIASRYQKIRDSVERYSGPPKPAGSLAKDMAALYAVALLLARRGQPLPGYDLLDRILAALPSEEEGLQDCAARLADGHPGQAEVILRHGDILFRTGKRDKALGLYAEAAKAGQVDAVVERLAPVARAEEKNIPVQQFLAQLYVQQQRPDEALTLVRKLWQADKRNPESYLGMMQEIVKLNPSSVEARMTMGDAALESRKYDLALSSFAKVAGIDPARLDDILERYRKIMELAPDNSEAAVMIVDAYQSAGRTDQAVSELRRMLARDASLLDMALEKADEFLKPDLDQPKILIFLAECHLMRQESAKASRVYLYLAGLGPEGREAALQGLQGLVAVNPEDPEPMLSLLRTLLDAGRFPEASLIGRELAKRHSKSWPSYLPFLESASEAGGEEYNSALAGICSELEKAQGAEKAFSLTLAEALARSQQFARAGEIFLGLSSDEQAAPPAIGLLEELSEKYPQAGPLHLAMAEICQRRGEMVKMAASFLAASKVDRTLIPKVSASLQELLGKAPDNAELQLLQLDLLFQQRLLENAFKLANAILIKWPGAEGSRAYLRVGQIYLEKGELTKAAGGLLKASELDHRLSAEAVESLQRLLEIDSTSLAGRYALGKVLFHQKRYDASVEELMAVCLREPKWAEKIIADLKAVEKADPVNRNVLLAEAKVSFLLKRNDDAVAALSQLMEVSPESFDQALDVYQRLLARDPDQPKVKMALAKALVLNGRTAEGVALVRESIGRDPGLVEPAITLLRLALDRDPEDLESGYLLANLYCQRGGFAQGLEILRAVMDSRPDQADRLSRELESVLKLKPDLPQARYFMTEILISGRKYAQAVANLEAILRQQPAERQSVIDLLERILSAKDDQLEALLLRSRILVEVGQIEPAVDGFVRAAEASAEVRPQVLAELEKLQAGNQGLGRIHEALGTIYFETGRFPQARDALSQAVKLISDGETKIRLLFFLAESHLALRNEAKAEEAMDEVKSIMPDADEVYKALRRFSTRRLQVEIDKTYQAIQEAPDDQFKKLDLAGKLLVIEKYDSAAKLLAFKPQDEEVGRRRLLLLARAFLGKNEAYTAIELMRQVPLSQHPFNRFQMDVCYLLGQSYEAVGNYAGAVSAYRNIYMDQTDYRDVKRRMDHAAEKAVLKELGHRATMLESTAAVHG